MICHFLSTAFLIACTSALRTVAENFLLPGLIANGSAVSDSVASYNAIDSVQVRQPNGSSYEWWYFDAVSADSSAAVVFQPHLEYFNEETPLKLRLNFAFNNGSFSELIIPGDALSVSTIGAGSSGIASDGSYSWKGDSDLSKYTITLDIPEKGISGEIHLQSVSLFAFKEIRPCC